jgi:hypothetical protein
LSAATAAAPARELLIGAWGWDHPAWVGPFYPEDMPAEWRLAYYAHAFGAVLVPAPVLAAAPPGAVEAWALDAPSPFVFGAELGPPFDPADPASVAGFAARLSPLEARIAAVVVNASVGTPDAAALDELGARWPLEWLTASGSGSGGGAGGPRAAWRPGTGLAPGGRDGCFGLMDERPRTPRELRAALEGFLGWAGRCPRVFLCFPGAPHTWREMEQVRVIAEFLVG